MSYQVLARKYRPRTFHELVGQEHVSRALTNALDQDRLHHAYLFTGTRGVGKTTIARILSRCLNCEQGISSVPCGVCDTCVEIGEGRFVDLIEVDAASRTKVEDTRELLDNVQYAPTRGRYKVYLIDEVHMLSGHSFNALLKTLEEPPPHVKFLLATTDPQKLPVTILSRCLQFNLKALPVARIAEHLASLLQQEMLEAEAPALQLLGETARGSMRDALSLTDQAISFCGSPLTESAVRTMLGTVDRAHVLTLLAALAEGEAPQVLAALDQVMEQSPDEAALLDGLIAGLHQVAVCQAIPAREADTRVSALATTFSAEAVQLCYDIALRGRADLAESPSPRAGLEMLLLRMVLFRPQGVLTDGGGSSAKKPVEPGLASAAVAPAPPSAKAAANEDRPSAATGVSGGGKAQQPVTAVPPSPAPQVAQPVVASAGASRESGAEQVTEAAAESTPQQTVAAASIAAAPPPERSTSASAALDDEWAQLVASLPIDGPLLTLAQNCVLERHGLKWQLWLESGKAAVLLTAERQRQLQAALVQRIGADLQLQIGCRDEVSGTPAQRRAVARQAHLERTRELISGDPVVAALCREFDATLDIASIQPHEEC